MNLSPESIKAMNSQELKNLAATLREEIIDDVSKTGGHLASNLGVVELTIALHRVFDTSKDRIVFDVGHQAYVHKIITGRREAMKTLRQIDGLSGFPKRNESLHDAYDSGHSGSSISAALGYACARDLKKEDYSCVAVIGDGAMTGGIAFEALNAAGSAKVPLIVILNDNAMSISANVGGLSHHLQRIRTKTPYIRLKTGLKNALKKSPKFIQRLQDFRDAVKYALLPGAIFEELGFKYFGPVDGHDIDSLIYFFEAAKKLNRPVMVHCITKKGKGFLPAEQNPEKYHGVGPFDPKTADANTKLNPQSWSEIFGKSLCEEAKKNEKLCAVTAAMTQGTGLSSFKELYPKRFFDAGIAEQHAVSFAAGLSLSGFHPVVALYSTFLQRAYDQVLGEVCLQNLPMVFAIDRAGIVGADGSTHQGLYDIEFLSAIPGLTLLSPRDERELSHMLSYAISKNSPVAIRYPRGNAPKPIGSIELPYNPKPQCLLEGKDLVFLSDGASIPYALEAAEILKEKGLSCGVFDMKQLKPLDEDFLNYAFSNWKVLVTIEDGDIENGMGTRIASYCNNYCNNCRILKIGWPDAFIEQGSPKELRIRYNLDAVSIANRTEKFFENKT